MNRGVRLILSAAFLGLSLPGVAAAENAIRENWLPATSGLGDIWTVSCPAGGSMDVTVQNRDDGNGSEVDLRFEVRDSAGVFVTGADDEVVCLNQPSCFGCPQDLAIPCTAGGTYSIVVIGVGCGATGTGGGYSLAVEVKDSAAVALSAKKAKLGGGPKSKVPAWHSATSSPAVDDGSID